MAEGNCKLLETRALLMGCVCMCVRVCAPACVPVYVLIHTTVLNRKDSMTNQVDQVPDLTAHILGREDNPGNKASA